MDRRKTGPNAMSTSAVVNPEFFHRAAVIGTGPTGLASALALHRAKTAVVLVGPPVALPYRDERTTALFGASIELLRALGLWTAIEPNAAPLEGLRLIDDAGGILRAPELLFEARETGRDAFGFNVENALLVPVLARAVCQTGLPWIEASADKIEVGEDRVVVRLADGHTQTAELLVGADGRHSICRTASGASTRDWRYPQAALATQFTHTRPHNGISTEFHRRPGPLTTVPLAGRRSSLVWVETTEEAHRLATTGEKEFAATLEERLQGLLGSVSDIGRRAVFPLSGLAAKPLAANRIALVGEAAHVMPPIGAQGLNLGFRDVAWLTDAVSQAIAEGRDIGSNSVLNAYAASRQSDILLRSTSVDLLNRSLIAGFAPFDLARRAGLLAVGAVPWLRQLAVEAGIGPEPPPFLTRLGR